MSQELALNMKNKYKTYKYLKLNEFEVTTNFFDLEQSLYQKLQASPLKGTKLFL